MGAPGLFVCHEVLVLEGKTDIHVTWGNHFNYFRENTQNKILVGVVFGTILGSLVLFLGKERGEPNKIKV